VAFAQAVAAQQAAVFDHLGVAAWWNGSPNAVRVRLVERDESDRFAGGGAAGLFRTTVLKVRRSEVETPRTGDQVELDEGGRRFRLSGDDPSLDAKGVWTCSVTELV
jgi:hypothetical protein